MDMKTVLWLVIVGLSVISAFLAGVVSTLAVMGKAWIDIKNGIDKTFQAKRYSRYAGWDVK